jgi:hypothetical protein
MTAELIALCGFAFLAGFVDSIVGGGGLIQVPALFILLPGVPAATLLGTNKCASIWGTLGAAVQYSRRIPVPWAATLPTCVTALFFSFLGARTITFLDPAILRPLVLAMLIVVLAYTLWNKNFGALHTPRLSHPVQVATGLATGAAIGFYDGFFGPGTGSFLIFAFVGVFGFSFLAASATAKIVNVATNFAAIAWFAASGHVLAGIAIPMAVFNVAGSLVGTRLALRHGSGFVRILFLAVVGALILRYAWDLLKI